MGKVKEYYLNSDGFYPDELIEVQGDFESESDVRDYLKSKIPDIEDTDEMCHYDMETPKSIIEIKVRRKFYDKWLIEEFKYNKLIELSNEKACIYVVAYKNKLYWCDLKKIDLSQIERIVMPCPKSTDFKNNEIIDKVNYILPMSKMKIHSIHN